MKTVKDFVHRLHHDPEFEQRAHIYEDSDEFMNFVKSEGYDFTLDQLLEMFKGEEAESPETAEPPTSPGVEAFIQRLEQDPEFERQAQSFENNDAFMEFVRKAGYDFTLDQLTGAFKRNQKEEVKPEVQQQPPSPPAKLEALPAPQPAAAVEPVKLPETSVLEPVKPPETSVDASQTQERPVRLTPKFKGFIGGRRRGMRWSDGES
jgi:predicted ribosomally synthesized peptide with nif11-like leader